MPLPAPRLCRTADELELTLSPEAARLLASALRRPEAVLPTLAEGSPAPYDEWLSGIAVRRRETGKVVMTVDEATSALVVEGELRYLNLLAGNVEGFADDAEDRNDGDHLHIEYHEEHYYLAPCRISLVIVAEG